MAEGQAPTTTTTDDAPPHDFYNVMAQVFLWILLAGFLVLPSTFPNIQTIVKGSGTLTKVVHTARNVPLYVPSFPLVPLFPIKEASPALYANVWNSINRLVIAFVCCGIGTFGLCLLWWKWSHKYAWLLSTIFIPGMFSGLSGVISTFVGIYGAQQGVHYSGTTIATVAATGGCSVICGFLSLIYAVLKRLKARRGGQGLEGSHSVGQTDGDGK
jgi:hypothetical protein